MLEPLIVLTVLNCFFMFSSTVTTCALWWQYRSHRCCFKRDSTQQGVRHNLTKSKNNPTKKPGNSKQDNHVNPVDRSKSNTTVNHRSKKRRSNQKSNSNARYLLQEKIPSSERLSSTEMMESWDTEDRTRMSEASQTGNEPKSAVVMEYSTVQKIVQILDSNTDLTATKLIIKDLNAKQNDEKRDSIESQFESQTVSEFTPVAQRAMTLLPPTVKQQKRIDEEVPADPEMRRRDVAAIREWLAKQPHLPNHMDDARLERVLFGCKNSIERCKLILERYFSVRTAMPEFFAVRDPLARDIQECCESIYYFSLPSLTDEGHRVSVLRLRNPAVDKFSIQAISRRILMALDTRLMEERCLSNIMVIDLEGFSMVHFTKCSPTQSIVRKAMLAVQDSMPLRLHRVHYLHAPAFIESVLNIFYPLLKERLVQKFRIHTGGGEELHSYMDKDILPNEWGGKAGTFDELNDAWKKRIEKSRDWFLREEKLSRTNERARLPESKSRILVELEGLQGSFRQLNID